MEYTNLLLLVNFHFPSAPNMVEKGLVKSFPYRDRHRFRRRGQPVATRCGGALSARCAGKEAGRRPRGRLYTLRKRHVHSFTRKQTLAVTGTSLFFTGLLWMDGQNPVQACWFIHDYDTPGLPIIPCWAEKIQMCAATDPSAPAARDHPGFMYPVSPRNKGKARAGQGETGRGGPASAQLPGPDPGRPAIILLQDVSIP